MTNGTTRPTVTEAKLNTKTCHGCGGKGWVRVGDTAQTCPVCLGKGELLA